MTHLDLASWQDPGVESVVSANRGVSANYIILVTLSHAPTLRLELPPGSHAEHA